MKRARSIVLGSSHWHVPLYADRIARLHDVVGVSDPDPSRVEHLARLWNAPLHSSWQDVLAAHGDAELAYVFVPHNEMRKVCLALIRQRIPLVVEKPDARPTCPPSRLRRNRQRQRLPRARHRADLRR
jgi:predicted dehydrogenase